MPLKYSTHLSKPCNKLCISDTAKLPINIQMKCPTHSYIVGTLADEIQAQYDKNRWLCGKPVQKRNALENLFSAKRREREKKE